MTNESKTIFISRELETKSYFNTLKDYGYTLFGFSLLNIKVLPFIHVPDSDWLYFYSKNAVYYFFEQLSEKEKQGLHQRKIAAHGIGTAKKIKEYTTVPVDFIFNHQTEALASDFVNDSNTKVLFLRAKRSIGNVEEMMKNVEAFHLPVYVNEIKEDIDIPNAKYLIFTSPMNVESYLQKKQINEDQEIFAIGKSTFKKLTNHGLKNKILMPTRPSEKDLYELVLDNIH